MENRKERLLATIEDGQPVDDSINQNFYFLGIGIDAYENMDQLDNPVKEVKAIRDILVERYGFPFHQTELLLDENATREAIVDRIYKVCTSAKEEASVVIYFAGHGYYENDNLQQGYWMPYNAPALQELSPVASSISNQEVVDIIAKGKPLHVLLLVDSCFGGSIFQTKKRMTLNSQPGDLKHPSRYAISSGMKEPVEDQSSFFHFLKEAFERNTDEYFSGPDLYAYISKKMRDRKTKQTPVGGWLACDRPNSEFGNFFFELQDEWVELPKKERMVLWKVFTVMHSFLLVLGLLGLLVTALLSWKVDYWPRLFLCGGISLSALILLRFNGFAPVLFKGKRLSKQDGTKRQIRINRWVLGGMTLLHTLFVLVVLQALWGYQTLEVTIDPAYSSVHNLDPEEEKLSLTIRAQGEVKPFYNQVVDIHEVTKIRLSRGTYFIGLKMNEGEVVSGGVAKLRGGITTKEIRL